MTLNKFLEAVAEKLVGLWPDRHVFVEWSEKMLDEFESLTVVETESRSRLVHLTNVTARKDDDSRVYQFLFDADFYFVITPEAIPTMYYLGQDNTIRSEVIE